MIHIYRNIPYVNRLMTLRRIANWNNDHIAWEVFTYELKMIQKNMK